MLTAFLELAGGFALLVLGAHGLVAGAASLAVQMGISAAVVGLTVIAYGTSLPEATVSAVSAFSGNPEIALGNVLGSNIANIGLIIGLSALLRPMPVDLSFLKRDFPILGFTTLLLILFLLDGEISRWEGILLLGGGFSYTLLLLFISRGRPNAATEEIPEIGSRKKQVAYISLGLALLLAGGKLAVNGAVDIATLLGLSERVIGLTVVAVGTSLPELAASLVAALKNQSAMAIGNILGSNIFNILFVLGLSATIAAIRVPTGIRLNIDLASMVIFTVVFGIFMLTLRRVTRWEGLLLLGGYAAYTAYLLYT